MYSSPVINKRKNDRQRRGRSDIVYLFNRSCLRRNNKQQYSTIADKPRDALVQYDFFCVDDRLKHASSHVLRCWVKRLQKERRTSVAKQNTCNGQVYRQDCLSTRLLTSHVKYGEHLKGSHFQHTTELIHSHGFFVLRDWWSQITRALLQKCIRNIDI